MKLLATLLFIVINIIYANNITMYQSYEEALKFSPDLKIYQQKTLIEQEKQRQSLSPLLPRVDIILLGNKYIDSTTTNTSYKNNSSDYVTKTYELKLSQKLLDLSLLSEYQKSKLALKIKELEYLVYEQELVITVATAYLDLLAANNDLLVAQKKLTVLQQRKEDIQKRFDLGDATIQDLTNTDAKFYSAQSEKIEYELNLKIAKANFESITNIVIDKDNLNLSNISNNMFDNNVTNMEKLIEQSFTKNLNIQIKKLNIELSEQNIKSNKSAHYPTLDMIGNIRYFHTEESKTSQAYENRQNYIGLQLKLPLYSGGETNSKIKAAKAAKLLSKEELNSLKNQLKFNIIQEYMKLKTSVAQIKSLEIGLNSAKTTVEATQVGYEVGSRTHFEVLEAIEQFYNMKKSLSYVKYQYKLSELKLKLLVGTLNKQDLK